MATSILRRPRPPGARRGWPGGSSSGDSARSSLRSGSACSATGPRLRPTSPSRSGSWRSVRSGSSSRDASRRTPSGGSTWGSGLPSASCSPSAMSTGIGRRSRTPEPRGNGRGLAHQLGVGTHLRRPAHLDVPDLPGRSPALAPVAAGGVGVGDRDGALVDRVRVPERRLHGRRGPVGAQSVHDPIPDPGVRRRPDGAGGRVHADGRRVDRLAGRAVPAQSRGRATAGEVGDPGGERLAGLPGDPRGARQRRSRRRLPRDRPRPDPGFGRHRDPEVPAVRHRRRHQEDRGVHAGRLRADGDVPGRDRARHRRHHLPGPGRCAVAGRDVQPGPASGALARRPARLRPPGHLVRGPGGLLRAHGGDVRDRRRPPSDGADPRRRDGRDHGDGVVAGGRGAATGGEQRQASCRRRSRRPATRCRRSPTTSPSRCGTTASSSERSRSRHPRTIRSIRRAAGSWATSPRRRAWCSATSG